MQEEGFRSLNYSCHAMDNLCIKQSQKNQQLQLQIQDKQIQQLRNKIQDFIVKTKHPLPFSYNNNILLPTMPPILTPPSSTSVLLSLLSSISISIQTPYATSTTVQQQPPPPLQQPQFCAAVLQAPPEPASRPVPKPDPIQPPCPLPFTFSIPPLPIVPIQHPQPAATLLQGVLPCKSPPKQPQPQFCAAVLQPPPEPASGPVPTSHPIWPPCPLPITCHIPSLLPVPLRHPKPYPLLCAAVLRPPLSPAGFPVRPGVLPSKPPPSQPHPQPYNAVLRPSPPPVSCPVPRPIHISLPLPATPRAMCQAIISTHSFVTIPYTSFSPPGSRTPSTRLRPAASRQAPFIPTFQFPHDFHYISPYLTHRLPAADISRIRLRRRPQLVLCFTKPFFAIQFLCTNIPGLVWNPGRWCSSPCDVVSSPASFLFGITSWP